MNLSDLPTLPDPGDAFNAAVMQSVRAHQKRQRHQLQSAAVALILLAAGGWWHLRTAEPAAPLLAQAEPEDARAAAVTWLTREQEADGSWSAARWGGHERFTPGVSALATLALLQDAPESHLDRAGAWLLEHLSYQTPALMEGPLLYNHLLSLRALVALEAQSPAPERAARLRAALHQLARLQQPEGGWGYAADSAMGYHALLGQRANSAITWWIRELMDQGAFLMPEEAGRVLARADAWLTQCFAADGTARYHPGGAAAAPDQALYWMARLWRGESAALPTAPTPDFYRDIWMRLSQGEVPPHVLPLQMADGAWPRDADRWGLAGGRVYATAAALLATVPGPPAAR